MILSGPEIRNQISDGNILIEPFDDAQINPASYDLRLGRDYATYVPKSHKHPNTLGAVLQGPFLNCREPETLEIRRDTILDHLTLMPDTLYLMHTVERVRTRRFVPIVDGKSSIGRLGVFVHVTAGYGDPGFDGQYTLEVLVTYPTVVYPGMRFAQIRFHTIQGEVEIYKGNYLGEFSQGPQPSRIWKQFEKESR